VTVKSLRVLLTIIPSNEMYMKLKSFSLTIDTLEFGNVKTISPTLICIGLELCGQQGPIQRNGFGNLF